MNYDEMIAAAERQAKARQPEIIRAAERDINDELDRRRNIDGLKELSISDSTACPFGLLAHQMITLNERHLNVARLIRDWWNDLPPVKAEVLSKFSSFPYHEDDFRILENRRRDIKKAHEELFFKASRERPPQCNECELCKLYRWHLFLLAPPRREIEEILKDVPWFFVI